MKIARAKLEVMCRAAESVRADVLGTRGPARLRRDSANVHDDFTPAAFVRSAPSSHSDHSAAKRFDVLGVGNAIVDMVAEVDHGVVELLPLHRGSMTLVDDETSERLTAAAGWSRGLSGGSVANTTVGIVGLGGTASFTARIGDDVVGTVFAEDIRQAGVHFVAARPADASGLANDFPDAATGPGSGRCLVLVTPDGERTMATYLGASILIEPDHLAPDLLTQARVVYLEGYLADAPRDHRYCDTPSPSLERAAATSR